jgi:hypothetical protein
MDGILDLEIVDSKRIGTIICFSSDELDLQTSAVPRGLCLKVNTTRTLEETAAQSDTCNVSPQQAIARTLSRIRGTCDDMELIVLGQKQGDGRTSSIGKGGEAEAENGEVGGAGAGPASPAARVEARDARALRRSWAQLIKLICEVNPLVCPLCGSEMKVIAFITEHDVVDAILRHLAKAEVRSPRGPPGAAAFPVTS